MTNIVRCVDGKEQENITCIPPWISFMSFTEVNRAREQKGVQRCTVAIPLPRNQENETMLKSGGLTDVLGRRLLATMAISAPPTRLPVIKLREFGNVPMYPNSALLVHPAIRGMGNAKLFPSDAQR
jgi:hypothetical protein